MLLGLCLCSLLRATQTRENSTAQKKSEFPGKEKKIHSNNVSLIKRYLAQKTQNCNKRSVVMREKGDIDKRIMCWWEAFSCRSKNTAGRKWNCLRGRKKMSSSQPRVHRSLLSEPLSLGIYPAAVGWPAAAFLSVSPKQSLGRALAPRSASALRRCHSVRSTLRGSVYRDQSGTGFYIHCSLILISEIGDPAVETLQSFMHSLLRLYFSPLTALTVRFPKFSHLRDVFAVSPVQFRFLFKPCHPVIATGGHCTDTLMFLEVRFHHSLRHDRLSVFRISICVSSASLCLGPYLPPCPSPAGLLWCRSAGREA